MDQNANVNQDGENGTKHKRYDRQGALNALMQVGPKLCELIPPGDVIYLRIPVQQDILIPGQEKRFEQLIVIRPVLHLTVEPKPLIPK